MIDPQKFLTDLSGRYAKDYARAVSDMLIAMARDNGQAFEAARNRLGNIIRETKGVAEILGASITLREAARANITFEPISPTRMRPRCTASNLASIVYANSATQTILPSVTFEEALEDFVSRSPVTIKEAAQRTARKIAELYSKEHVVAFAKSAEEAVTDQVNKLITRSMREGIAENDAGRIIRLGVDEVRERTGPWSEGYARMAFRTNVNTAVTAGRFRQAQDPDIKAVLPAFRFDAVNDSDTRDNHAAADGLVMTIDNPAWQTISPPLGYNCRCQVTLLGLPVLRRMGRVNPDGSIREDRPPSNAGPDEGFRSGRPDLMQVTG